MPRRVRGRKSARSSVGAQWQTRLSTAGTLREWAAAATATSGLRQAKAARQRRGRTATGSPKKQSGTRTLDQPATRQEALGRVRPAGAPAADNAVRGKSAGRAWCVASAQGRPPSRNRRNLPVRGEHHNSTRRPSSRRPQGRTEVFARMLLARQGTLQSGRLQDAKHPLSRAHLNARRLAKQAKNGAATFCLMSLLW